LERKRYQGVEGWLLAFCAVLVFWIPMQSFYDFFVYCLPALVHEHDFKHKLQTIVYSIVVLGVAVFALISGIRLWLVRDGAVRLAKIWLLTFLCAHLAYFLFWLALFRSIHAERLAEMAWYHVVGPLGPFYLWNIYLEHSKRVGDTYFSN
jgi:hypothetical protein